MKPKHLMLLFAAFVVIAGFVYFYEYKGGLEREAASEWASKTFKIANPQDIVGLTLQTPQGTITAVRENGEWQITAPFQVAAEDGQWDGIVNAIMRSTINREISSELRDLSKYGLNIPRATVTLMLADGSEKSFLVGAESKASKGGVMTFVKWADSSRVVTTENTLFTTLDKSLFDLRDKSIFHIEKEPRIAKIELEKMGQKVVLEKLANRWMITEPVNLVAMPSAVNSLISGIKGLKARDFVVEEPQSLKPYGMEDPVGRAVFVYDDSTTSMELRLGDKRSANELYVHWLGKHPVAIIDTTQAKQFVRTAFDFQDKKLKPFDIKLADRITMTGDMTLDIFKRDTLGWFSVAGDTLKTDKVESLLRNLSNLQADAVGDYYAENLALYGLQGPRRKIIVMVGDTVLSAIWIGTKLENECFAKWSESPHVYKLRNWRIGNLEKTVDDLK
ncbi:MAG: DUF4340 domain-containing protein [Lentisphaeria bacterium]|nr:DUF4340 domain-containing protein [Candidatus Neomarinimicrobiota bacterium]MCF7842909.1 DUF4340 domain-containing protein [Lentisphaeria bacterium]